MMSLSPQELAPKPPKVKSLPLLTRSSNGSDGITLLFFSDGMRAGASAFFREKKPTGILFGS